MAKTPQGPAHTSILAEHTVFCYMLQLCNVFVALFPEGWKQALAPYKPSKNALQILKVLRKCIQALRACNALFFLQVESPKQLYNEACCDMENESSKVSNFRQYSCLPSRVGRERLFLRILVLVFAAFRHEAVFRMPWV